MQVEPQTPLPTVYQITNHLDSNRDTYYVRAVVRDSLTGSTITTVNLTNYGNGRYASQFPAPIDGTGLGRQIDVTVTVYSDSGYSVKVDDYQQTIEKWYVKSTPISYGGGSSSEVDYDQIEKILRDILKEEKDSESDDTEEVEAPEPVDLTPVLSVLDSIMQQLDVIATKENKVNFSDVIRSINTAKQEIISQIDSINIPPPADPVDYNRIGQEVEDRLFDSSPIVQAVEDLSTKVSTALEQSTESQKSEITAAVTETIKGILGPTIAHAEKVKKAMADFISMTPPVDIPTEEKVKKEDSPIISRYFKL